MPDTPPTREWTSPMRQTTLLIRALIAALAVSVTAGACSPDENTVKVKLKEFAFEMPAKLPAGPAVFVVENLGQADHNIKIEGQGIAAEFERDLAPGETGRLKVDLKPGTYEVTCPVGRHTQLGMRLTLTVTELAKPGAAEERVAEEGPEEPSFEPPAGEEGAAEEPPISGHEALGHTHGDESAGSGTTGEPASQQRRGANYKVALARLVVPFGITTISFLFVTASVGLLQRKKPKVLHPLHKRLAYTTGFFAFVHLVLVLLSM